MSCTSVVPGVVAGLDLLAVQRARRDVAVEGHRVGADRGAGGGGRAAAALQRAGLVDAREAGDELSLVEAVDAVGVQAGRDAGGVRGQRADGVAAAADVDAPTLTGGRLELEGAAVGQVDRAQARVGALRGAAAVDRAAAVVGLVGLAGAERRGVGDDLGLARERLRLVLAGDCGCRPRAGRPRPPRRRTGRRSGRGR
jgi:hypothetical protein